jgi:hypothetical protein
MKNNKEKYSAGYLFSFHVIFFHILVSVIPATNTKQFSASIQNADDVQRHDYVFVTHSSDNHK